MALRVLSLVLPLLLVLTVAVNTATREYSQQREAARAKVAPRGPSGALPPTTLPRTEYSQQREAARAKVAPRGPSGALPPTTLPRTGTWAARNHEITRIIDGKPAYVSQFPHQAYVRGEGVINGYGHVMHCGGSLVSKSAVLTGAYCVHRYEQWTIRLGGIHRTEDEETAWTTVSSWALVHPEYNNETSYADLAIIFLVRDAPLSDFIKPVTLPSSLEANANYHSKTGVISGWGFTSQDIEEFQEVLHWTEVKVIPTEICGKFYTSMDMRDKLCAANENSGGHWGDEGTGLTLRTTCGFTQIGLFSLQRGHISTRPAAYTRVASYIDWINIKAPISNFSVAN